MAPWRDSGANRLFSTHVFGTPFMLDENGEAMPWIATGIAPDERYMVWTMKLREDAVFQDGTPITAADFKAYWEHGAKPENNVAWGGASLTIGDIRGWGGLLAGDVSEAEGLVVIDDQTLVIETVIPRTEWPLYMAAWHVGISKLEQLLNDRNWGNAPIGAGPFSLIYHPDSGLTELTRTDLVGGHWNGPHDTPIIERLLLSVIEDEQARLVLFENGELDVMSLDTEAFQPTVDSYPRPELDVMTRQTAVDPNHPLLYVSPYAGLQYIQMDYSRTSLRYPLARQALAHGVNMEGIVSAIWGPTATHAKGLITSTMPCHNPDADYQPYDPDLARQELSAARQELSDRGRSITDDLSTLMIDLYRPNMVDMGVAMKEYWKDNLGLELDILKLESGVARREWPHLIRMGWSSWIPDPLQVIEEFTRGSTLQIFGIYGDPHEYSDISLTVEAANSVAIDHPDRCAWLQRAQRRYLETAFVIPIREIAGGRWLVQPWLRGFKSTFNQDFNTLTTAYVARH